ncbi:unnamed protein product [Orchesella dallaii]|uniref:Calcium-activated chloride channel N-terminal domain-containing protein n=1 Tax=Orchesella dallaii TaxID=48710 RepID=A0ABP1QUE5_9HEXA
MGTRNLQLLTVTRIAEIILFIFLLIKPSENSIVLNQNGGYSIVLAINENIPEPQNGGLLIVQNVQSSFEMFSTKLWEATNGRFHIESVDILVPSSWNIENSSDATTQSYGHASIRVSSTAERPYTENPNVCGKPGHFIELPLLFLNSTDPGPYGPRWKALLNLWATYRWGVHEEHGYIGNFKFPYSYRDLSSNEWKVTGCSDQPIAGEYVDAIPSIHLCSPLETLNSSSSCRFVPSLNQSSTTSLMHFHWVDSIVNFCDESNHDKLAPNPHNSKCDHKSVWEVLRETEDYKAVTSALNSTRPEVAFQVVKHNPKPVLYILLDRGLIQGSLRLAYTIPRAIINFLGDPSRSGTVAAVSSYPSLNRDEVIQRDILWSPIGSELNRFADVIGNLRVDGPLERDFSQAILAAVEDIKTKGHPNGVVMLMIKYGADLNNFGSYVPESDVINALNEAGVIFNSIELGVEIDGSPTVAHIAELARQTGGMYTTIVNNGVTENSIRFVTDYLRKTLDEHYVDLKMNFRTILKTNSMSGLTANFKVPSAPINMTATEKVQAYFSSLNGSLTRQNFTVMGQNNSGNWSSLPLANINFRKSQDWLNERSKWSYILELKSLDIASYTELRIQANCTSCQGTFLIRSDIRNENTENVAINVFTNFDGSSVDLSINQPIIIYAQVLKNGVPVVNSIVDAVITESESNFRQDIRLWDNGEVIPPDEVEQDGIYSGYFAPNTDGNFQVAVSVRGDYQLLKAKRDGKNLSVKKNFRLLPIDQVDMGCIGASCKVEYLPEEFMSTSELSTRIRITGTVDYSPEPTKITTFLVYPTANQQNMLTLSWMAPTVPGRLLGVSSYDIRQSTNQQALITDFGNQVSIPVLPNFAPGNPGSWQTHQIPRPGVTTFYAIRSSYRGTNSKISDVQAFEFVNDQEESTTTDSSVSTSPTPTDSSTSPPTSTTSLTGSPPDSSTSPPTSTTSTGSTPDSSTSTPTSSDSTTTPTNPETSSTTASTNPSSTSASPSSSSSSPPFTSTLPSDDKSWHETGGGIAIITILVVAAVAVIAAGGFYLWRRRTTDKGQINPPPATQAVTVP